MAGIKSRTLAACCGDSDKGEPWFRPECLVAPGPFKLDLTAPLLPASAQKKIEQELREKAEKF